MGASRGTRRAITTLGFAHGVTSSFLAAYEEAGKRSKTLEGFVERIRSICAEGFELWPERLNERQLKKVHQLMEHLEGGVVGTETEFPVLTSVVLGLIEDLRKENLKPKRRAMLVRLESVYRQLHRHYDRRLDKFDAYDKAKEAVNTVKEEIMM